MNPLAFSIFIVLAVVVLVGLIMAANQAAAANRATLQQLETRGITTEGHLLSKQAEEQTIDKPGTGTSRTETIYTYSLTYTYGVDGQLYEHGEIVDKDRYERVHKGDIAKIRYLPDNPNISRVMFDS